jgi:WD40 repeat protein
VISTFSTGKMAHVVKLHPDDSKQNILLAGCSDKKIVQWDMNTGDIVQEYDQHLGGVNTITFCDENRRFVTTSDDKTIRVWCVRTSPPVGLLSPCVAFRLSVIALIANMEDCVHATRLIHAKKSGRNGNPELRGGAESRDCRSDSLRGPKG